MKKIAYKLITAAMVVMAAAPGWSANTITNFQNVIVVSAMDSDFQIKNAYAGSTQSSWKLISIQFYGGAVSDRLVIKNGSDTGPVMFDRVADDLNYPPTQYYFGAEFDPLIDFSACTLSAGHKVIFILSR